MKERLTIKDKSIRDNFNAEYAKLADLEDIEQELGIDLITLFKALKNGVWVKGYGTDVIILWISCIDGRPMLDSKECGILQVKDYGRTWALTKEKKLCQKVS